MSLVLDLGSLSAMNSKECIAGNCVWELYLDPSLTGRTAVDFLVSFQSLVFPQRLFGLLVLYLFSIVRNQCCQFFYSVT